MSNTEIQSKVNELRELRRMADELTAEIESIQDAIKAHQPPLHRGVRGRQWRKKRTSTPAGSR